MVVREGDNILTNFHCTPDTSAFSNSHSDLVRGNHATVLCSCLTAYLDYPNSQLKVKVVHAAAQHLGPQAPTGTTAPIRSCGTATEQGINANGIAHSSELGAKLWIGPDFFGMANGKLMEQRLEDGELSLQGARVSAA